MGERLIQVEGCGVWNESELIWGRGPSFFGRVHQTPIYNQGVWGGGGAKGGAATDQNKEIQLKADSFNPRNSKFGVWGVHPLAKVEND